MRDLIIAAAVAFTAGWAARARRARRRARQWPQRAVTEMTPRMREHGYFPVSVTVAGRSRSGRLSGWSMREGDVLPEWTDWGRVPGDAKELEER